MNFLPLPLEDLYNGHTDDALLLYTLLPKEPFSWLSQRRNLLYPNYAAE